MSFTGSTFGRYSARWLIVTALIELGVAAVFLVLALQIPVVAGGFFLTAAILGVVGVVLLVIALRVRGSSAATDQVLASGVAGTATITGVTQTGMYLNDQPRIKMDLLVQLPGQAPYAAEHSEFVPLILLYRVQPGATLPVRVNPAEPQKIAVDWSGAGTLTAAPMTATPMPAMPTTAGALMPGMPGMMVGPMGTPMPMAAPPAPPMAGLPGSGIDESMGQVQAALASSGAAVPNAYATPDQANLSVDQLRAWLRANGVAAQAHVDYLEDTGKIVGDDRLYIMEMTLLVPGSAPEKLQRSAAMVPLSAMPRLRQDMTLPVAVAAQNHQLLTVEWDKV